MEGAGEEKAKGRSGSEQVLQSTSGRRSTGPDQPSTPAEATANKYRLAQAAMERESNLGSEVTGTLPAPSIRYSSKGPVRFQ